MPCGLTHISSTFLKRDRSLSFVDYFFLLGRRSVHEFTYDEALAGTNRA